LPLSVLILTTGSFVVLFFSHQVTTTILSLFACICASTELNLELLLKKRITLETAQQQSRLFETLKNKPFWIWNIEEHKHEYIRTNGDCCFNHIIGLLQKDGIDKPLFLWSCSYRIPCFDLINLFLLFSH
jgi:hypothetical protein